MPAWKLSVRRSVLKDLRDLPKDVRGRAAVSMLELAADPYPSGTQKLRGYENSYRLRVGDYRILYEISGQDVTVVAVKHRREVYRDMV